MKEYMYKELILLFLFPLTVLSQVNNTELQKCMMKTKVQEPK